MSKRVLAGCTLGLMGLQWTCDQRASDSTGETGIPLVRDDQNRPRVWAGCPRQIIIEIDASAVRGKAIRDALHAAVSAWRVERLPRLRLQLGKGRRPNEDGVSSISFSASPDCSSQRMGPGMGCFSGDWRGLTRIYGRPQDAYFETVEADIFLDKGLLQDPISLQRVLVHELGHLFGLDHPKDAHSSGATVMVTGPINDPMVPGRADLRTLEAFYGVLCENSR